MNSLAKYCLPFPGVIRIEPSSACNLKCSHCPTGTVSMKRTVMSEAIFRRVMDQMACHTAEIRVVVMYHGGESLLNRSFFSMVRAVASLGIPHIKTVTNGMLLSTEIIDELLTCGLHGVELSLDAQNSEENDFIRRGVKTEELLQKVTHFLQRRSQLNPALKVSIASTQFIEPPFVMPDHKAPIPKYVYERLKISGIREEDFKCAFAMVWPHMKVEDHFQIYVDETDKEDSDFCDHVESTLTIRSDGTVVPCCYDLTTRLPMGNVMEKSLEEIWNGEPYLHLRQGIETKNYSALCQNCNVVRAKKRYLVKPKYPSESISVS